MTVDEAEPVGTHQRRPAGHRWRTAGVALGLGALAVGVLPAIAVADSVAGGTIYYGCVTTSTGAMNIVAKPTVCPAGQYKISWNKLAPRALKVAPARPAPPARPDPQEPPARKDPPAPKGLRESSTR